jgi:c-di-GMP-binding flagellar brake protein YcgR
VSETSPQDKRKHIRVPFIQEVEIIGLGMRRSMDLSVGGMYLETMTSFPVGTLLDLRFKLVDSDPNPITVQALVVYQQETVGLGLSFVNLSPQNRDRIQKYVEQQSKALG